MLVGIQLLALLAIIWESSENSGSAMSLWAASLSAVLVSTLFVGGFALIEPLFKELAKAEELLKKEKMYLEGVVQGTEDELRIARKIQQNLLPKTAPSLNGFDIAAASKPAVWTSGDYFDFIRLPDGKQLIVVADVSGHGTGPALVMAETRAYLRAIAERESDLGQILTSLNHSLADDVESNRFVTAFLVGIDQENRSFVFAAAGHDALVVDKQGKAKHLRSQAPPLGIISDLTINVSESISFDEDDILLSLTDGIPETAAPDGEQFTIERTIDLIHQYRAKSAREIVECLFEEVEAFAEGTPQSDDITAAVIKC